MSYTDDKDTFDGTFRVLDWLALTSFYGGDEYKQGNDTYIMSDSAAFNY